MIKLLFILLIPRIAFGSFTPQTVLTDISTGDTMSVNSSHEGLIFLGSDSNVCKETGGNLASILAQLQSGVAVTGTFWQSTQPVSGSVSVSNFPSSQAVTGTFWQSTQPVSGSVSVSNFPSTQPVSGSISVSNFPVTQPVSGSLGRTWNLGHASDSVSNYLNDGSGNVITSQSNGGQRALDIGIDVAGAQVDPRSIRALNSGTDSVSVIGSVTANAGTNLNTSALATSANLTAGTAKVQHVDGSGNVQGPFVTVGGVIYAPVVLAASGIAGSAVTSRTIQVGGSDGTNLQTLKTDTSGNQLVVGNASSLASDSGNPVKIGSVFNSTPVSPTNGQRVDAQSDSVGAILVNSQSLKATYSACVTDLNVAATPTDVLTVNGSATKKILITRISISGTETTTLMHDFFVIKRSSQNTGTALTLTAIPNDSSNSAATAVALAYNATGGNPTLGTMVGVMRALKYEIPATTGVNAELPIEITFGDKGGKPIVLNGTSEVVALNMNAVTAAGSSLNLCMAWTEE